MQFNFKFSGANSAVIVVTVVFLTTLFFAISNGLSSAKAESVNNTVVEIKKSLEFFYQDHERFPAQTEFTDSRIILNYFSRLPDNVSKTSDCPENFTYKRVSEKNYLLNFCLPHSFGGFQKGWNSLIGQK